ncbi:MAG: serine/threonine protein kinase [Deltaproteobacteria bacterium]|nr:serine/threonine protein kinase [Deltaproteobacteria bacterium]
MQLPYRHDRYLLVEELGRGGMAVVYRAKVFGPKGFVKEVAIKRVLEDWTEQADFTARLIDEAKVLTQLQHHNIVQVFELGRDQGTYFMVMEYVDGIDLAKVLWGLRRDECRLPEEHAYYVLLEVLQGIASVHAQVNEAGVPLQIVHRDVSPQNILLSTHGDVKLTDFGIAQGGHRGLATQHGQLKGKYAYMSPEQARGEPVDQRTDIFAVGALLFELLSGRRLFDGASDLQVLERVQCGVLPPRWEAAIHPGIRPILLRALAPQPMQRYATALALHADIRHFVNTYRCISDGPSLARFLRESPPSLCGLLAQRRQLAATAHGSRTCCVGPWALRLHSALVRTLRAGSVLMILSAGIVLSGTASTHMRRPEPKILARTIPPRVLMLPPLPVLPVAMPLEPIETLRSDAMEMAHDTPALAARAVPVNRSATVHASGRLIVRARPWGVVTIPGHVRSREAPVQVQLPAGEYPLQIAMGKRGHRLSRPVQLIAGEATECHAVFASRATLSCRQVKMK